MTPPLTGFPSERLWMVGELGHLSCIYGRNALASVRLESGEFFGKSRKFEMRFCTSNENCRLQPSLRANGRKVRLSQESSNCWTETALCRNVIIRCRNRRGDLQPSKQINENLKLFPVLVTLGHRSRSFPALPLPPPLLPVFNAMPRCDTVGGRLLSLNSSPVLPAKDAES